MPESTCQYNKLFVIQSLDPNEPQTGDDLVSAVKPVLAQFGIDVELLKAKTRGEFFEAMDNVWRQCATATPRVYPVLHLETHGFGDLSGISIRPPRERVTWEEFSDRCRDINRECHNNMMVTTGLCHGLHAISKITIRAEAPFFALVGPEDAVSIASVRGFVEFYKSVFESGDISAAMTKLSNKFRMFLAPRLFTNAFAAYLREDCKGEGREERIDRLLAQFFENHAGWKVSEENARAIIEEYTKPSEAAFLRFKERFLMSAHPLNSGRFDEVSYELAFEASNRSD